MEGFTVQQLSSALEGVPFPARRWQLAAWADWNCASSEMREALRHVPDKLYAAPEELADLFDEVDRRTAAAVEQCSPAGPAVAG